MMWLAGGIVIVLIAAAGVHMRRRAGHELRSAAFIFVLVLLPILALMSGGHGIRERHVITLEVVLALWAAAGLGYLLAAPGEAWRRRLGWSSLIALAALSVTGNAALLLRDSDWLPEIDRLRGGADLLIIVPRSAQPSVYAMMVGDSPLGSEPARWPPVCSSDTEWWCRRVDELQTVSVDAVSEEIVAAAAAAPRSVWIFAARRDDVDQRLPPQLDRCERAFRDTTWTVLRCTASDLR
jgi:hypothetical protein